MDGAMRIRDVKPGEAPRWINVLNKRNEYGLTQRQAAALVGVEVSVWRHWEGGLYRMPAKTWTHFLDELAQKHQKNTKKQSK